MSRYLVAGAGGFIGGHIVSSLLSDGHEVICADIKPFKYWFQFFEKCKNYSFDLRNPRNCEKASEGVDFNCFMGTGLDMLVIENFIMEKNNQNSELIQDYKDKYELD